MEEIKDIVEILELAKEEIENNNENITATLDLQDLKSLKKLLDLYNKEKEYAMGLYYDTQGLQQDLDKEKLNSLNLSEQLNKEKEKNTLINHLYKNLKDDFDSYKKDKDINYLDNNHHKKLVEKSIGQIINEPEECWFDAVEVKIIRNNILYGVNIDKDFITLKEISDEHPDMCMTVIAESPLSGAIYRYNNYGKKEWQLVGTMHGYA